MAFELGLEDKKGLDRQSWEGHRAGRIAVSDAERQDQCCVLESAG